MGQPANLMGIANAFQQGRDRLFQDRMAEVRSQFGEWNQHEPAKMQARMGQDTEVVLDMKKMHVFNPDTHEAVFIGPAG